MSKHIRAVPSARVLAIRLTAALALLAAGLAMAACGASKPGANAAATEQANEHDNEVKVADFAKCLREHGVNASSSVGPGGKGFGLKVEGKSGGGRQTMEAAQQACRKYRPEPKKLNLSPQEKVQRQEAVLKFAKCMREHGIDIHASATGGAIQIRAHASQGSAGPNPESPAFQSAQKACSGLLPGKLGSGPRAGGPSLDATKPGEGSESAPAG